MRLIKSGAAVNSNGGVSSHQVCCTLPIAFKSYIYRHREFSIPGTDVNAPINGKCNPPPPPPPPPPPRLKSGTYRRLVWDLTIVNTITRFDIGCGQQQMALRIDQLLTPNHGAFYLINVKSPICPGLGGGGGGELHLPLIGA